MSAEANTQLVLQHYREMDANRQITPELFGSDFKAHFPGAPVLDLDGFHHLVSGFFAGFPDLRHNIDFQLAQDAKVAVRLHVTGTHQGNFQGIPATGKAMNASASAFFQVSDGKITEIWVDADFMGLLQQIGALPAG